MNTSKRIAWANRPAIVASWHKHPNQSRYMATALFVVATVGCVLLLGIGSGLFTAIVLLMLAGSLSVLFFPFRYFGLREMLILYAVCLCLELIF
ncbi:hypothetical protein [Sphingobacterium suaedae]|uniref:Energy-coupling factor transporter transmembrane protein EcfT n=1 Tax=Sphingobacterium suaedae TaxID=1686402 RepID=A0ABW5KC91_9SPHI